LELGPQDFLHALYQKLSPFLEQDEVLNTILRTKTAEVLVMTPARLLTTQLGNSGFGWQDVCKDKTVTNEQPQLEVHSLRGDSNEQFVPATIFDNGMNPNPQSIFTRINHAAI
jgi:hypothetical protein